MRPELGPGPDPARAVTGPGILETRAWAGPGPAMTPRLEVALGRRSWAGEHGRGVGVFVGSEDGGAEHPRQPLLCSETSPLCSIAVLPPLHCPRRRAEMLIQRHGHSERGWNYGRGIDFADKRN